MLMVLLCVPTSATSSIFSILDDSYIKNISELPYSDGNPDKNIQVSGNIRGWIDITGFKNLTKKNNTYYVNDNPASLAIIQEKAWGEFKVPICSYSIKKSTSVYDTENYTHANLDIKMTWYSKHCGKNGCTCMEHVEYDVFQDNELSPIKVENQNKNIEVVVKERNITIVNSIEIRVKINDSDYDRYLFKTDNGYYEKINRIWHVENTTKGIYYANETNLDIFNSNNISHSQDVIVVDNNTNFSVISTGFYFFTNKTNTTKVYEYSNPVEQFYCGDLLGFLVVLVCFLVFYKYMLRQLT